MAEQAPLTDTRVEAFVAACLAPLLAGEEPADSPSFLLQMRRDAKQRWHHGMLHVLAAGHARDAASFSRLVALGRGEPEPPSWASEAAYLAAVDAQMQIPAVRLGDLRWRRQHREFAGGRPEWEEAIARDEARLTAAAGQG